MKRIELVLRQRPVAQAAYRGVLDLPVPAVAALWVLAAAFILAVLAFGRFRGLTALLGLGCALSVLGVILPSLRGGEDRDGDSGETGRPA